VMLAINRNINEMGNQAYRRRFSRPPGSLVRAQDPVSLEQ